MGLMKDLEKAGITKSKLIVGGAVLASFVLVSGSMFTVDEGNVGILKRFGKVQDQYNSGLHLKVPFIDKIEHLEVRTRKNAERLLASTFEQMPVTAETSVNWTVDKGQAKEMYISYGGLEQFENRILDPKLRSATKAALALFKAEQLVQNRSAAIAKIEEFLKEEMSEYPMVTLDSVQIENLILPEKYLSSIETKQTEKNLADAEKHKLDRQNLEAQREVNTANAARDASKARADGQAYATLEQAKAEAEAIRLKGLAEAETMRKKAEALANNAMLVEYTKAQQWNGQMPTTVMGEGQSVLMDLRKDNK
jgi:regulator of protease activity HflC (stomatin/prohibitin superfamily)